MIKYKMNLRTLMIVILLAFVMASCGGDSYKRPDLANYVWPRPPQEAKIKLVDYVITDLDIRKRTQLEELFGDEAYFGFGKPHGIAVDKNGTIYVSDTLKRDVTILNIKEHSITSLFNPYGFQTPMGIAVDDKHGLIAVADAGGGKVFIFNSKDYSIKIMIGQKGEFSSPIGVAIDPERGILYVSDGKKHEITSYTLDGEFISKIAGAGGAVGNVYFPAQLSVDKDGLLYVVDTMNTRIQIFDPKGGPARAFGEHGDRPGMFARPKGVAVASDGKIFVTDAAFGNFQIFDPEGHVYLFIGSTGRNLGYFYLPQFIFIDEKDRVYVVDQLNARIQIFQYFSDNYKRSLTGEPAPASPAPPIEKNPETMPPATTATPEAQPQPTETKPAEEATPAATTPEAQPQPEIQK